MKKKVSVFGLGYVGSVTAACLASQRHFVVGVDVQRRQGGAIAERAQPDCRAGHDRTGGRRSSRVAASAGSNPVRAGEMGVDSPPRSELKQEIPVGKGRAIASDNPIPENG